MTRKFLLLNLALLAAIGWFGWRIRLKWRADQAQERAFLSQAPRVRALLAPPAAPALAPVKPADYADVAEKTLFSKDRNPNVVVQPPPPPPPPPPMPPLPFYYGQMAIGKPVVLLSIAQNGDQKSYGAGDAVGKFKLLAFDRDSVTFEWDGKPVVRKIQDLVPKEAPPAPASAVPAAAAPVAGPFPDPPQPSNIFAPPPTKQELATKPPAPGVEMGGGFRGCVAGDTSPAGTISDGYRKTVTQSMMGSTCFWEKVK